MRKAWEISLGTRLEYTDFRVVFLKTKSMWEVVCFHKLGHISASTAAYYLFWCCKTQIEVPVLMLLSLLYLGT